MSANHSISIHRDIEDITNRYTLARKTLSSLLEERYYQEEILKPLILSKYDLYFRSLEIEIQQKALENSEVQRRSELFLMKFQRGEKLTPANIDLVHKIVDKEFLVIRQRMFSLQKNYKHSQKSSNRSDNGHLVQECIALYKSLAKRLHPDMGASPELTEKYWHSVQSAFDTKNLHSLQALHSLIVDSIPSDSTALTEFTIDTLRTELLKLEELIHKEQKEAEQRKLIVPYCYELGLEDLQWVNKHRNTLQSQIDKYNADIAKAQDTIRMLTGSPWKFNMEEFEKENPSVKDEHDYQDEFITSTYFSGRH